uniref:Centrosomal protein 63 n=1 Tax=Varanus komodoensis TaxID=61221 RepID=A0A8D2JJP6_VARKO
MEALLDRMQRQGQGRGFLTSCEAELQELMKQIDIMVAHKKAEWESQTQALESCLAIREQEIATLRNVLEEKRKETEKLCQRLEKIEQLNHEMSMEYEQQLTKVQEELGRLKRSYEKLLKKQLKASRYSSKSQEEDQSDVKILTKKLETQLSSRKQMFESVELANQSEIHHLAGQLERANDTICANELEVERLNMRVDDLTNTNQKILDEHQRLLDELKLSRNSLEVLCDEKMELRATLLSQEDFVDNVRLHNEQLQQEVSKLVEALCTKEAQIRALEQQLQNSEKPKGICQDGAELDHICLQLDHAEVTYCEESLGSANTKGIQPCEELIKKCRELQLAEEHLCQAKAEITKLQEQLSQKEQSHSSELEGMKQEVTQLTQELHQRDITIASSSGSALGLEQQLRIEIEKAERKAVEHRAILSQLETLRQENHHLSEMLHKVKSTPVTELQESCAKALNKVESENQRLQKELAETRARLEASSWLSQDKYESIVQQMQNQVTEIKNAENRRMQELQCKHEEELRELKARFDRTIQHYEEEIQKVQNVSARMVPVSNTAAGLSLQISRSNSVESLSCGPFLRTDPLSCGNKEFNYDVSSEHEREFLPLSPLPTSDIGAITAKFLEEEEVRSHHILECLDAHIEELKRESEKTVQQFTQQK